MGNWERPSNWDTDPSNPDYRALTVTFGEGVVVEGIVIVDRYDQVYIGGGLGLGAGTPLSGSWTSGYIGTTYDPSIPSGPSVTQNFLGGGYVNGSAGLIGGGGATYTLNGSNNVVPEIGIFAPSAGISIGYTVPLPWTMKTIPLK